MSHGKDIRDARIVTAVAILLMVVISWMSIKDAPQPSRTTTEWRTTDIVVVTIDPPKNFVFDYLDLNTGKITRHSSKYCFKYNKDKKIEVGKSYNVKLLIENTFYKDGTVDRVVKTNGCDLMGQIPPSSTI